MWTEADEEKYHDMYFVEIMTCGKRGVTGQFPDGILVKEVPMTFKYCKLFGDKLGIYLPEKEGDASHIGQSQYYPDEMGEYIECVSEDNKYFITVECQAEKVDEDWEEYIENLCDELDEKYDDNEVSVSRKYQQNDLEITILFDKISDETDYYCMIFVISKENQIYRLYFAGETQNYESMISLAYKIVENINVL